MDTWPFSSISPEDFTLLTECEKALLEELTAAFLAFKTAERVNDAPPITPIH